LLSKLVVDINATQVRTTITLTALQQSNWIPAPRQYIKSILHHSTVCRKVTAKPYSAPDPLPLPQLQTQDVHPFMFMGVEFTSALYAQQGKQEVKVYLCLFTCATTCAVQMLDLTAKNFLLAFRKFGSCIRECSSSVADE